MVSFSTVNCISAGFTESLVKKSGMLLGTVSTFILVFVVPIMISTIPVVSAVTSAPFPNLYWLVIFMKKT